MQWVVNFVLSYNRAASVSRRSDETLLPAVVEVGRIYNAVGVKLFLPTGVGPFGLCNDGDWVVKEAAYINAFFYQAFFV